MKAKRAGRGDTKTAEVIGLPMRPEGATIAQIMAETDWQQHTVRGFFAGTIKKKGDAVNNNKEDSRARVYRIFDKELRGAALTKEKPE